MTGSQGRAATGPRRRVDLPAEPAVTYAVGDVHGCLDELLALEAMILADGARYRGPRAIVMLGDYVDRGPDSAGVVEHLAGRSPEGFFRVCLAGNHDVEFLDLLEGRAEAGDWVSFAGTRMLQSYGCDLDEYAAGMKLNARRLSGELARLVPAAHRRFFGSLLACVSTPLFFFVHAGARPGVPLALQAEADLLWIREPFLSAVEPMEKLVVHGHSIVARPTMNRVRIAVDTGAFLGGGLSAVRIAPDGVAVLSTRG